MAPRPDSTPISTEAWFGPAFLQLHPLIQRLHVHGGVLAGSVGPQFGSGLAGLIGKRVARRLGFAPGAPFHQLQVSIRSAADGLHWDRTIDGQTFASTFTPVGRYPAGHWIETNGAISLCLGVAIIDGGWHWQQRSARLLSPRVSAFKEVRDGRYYFHVAIALPLVGTVLSYGGLLDAVTAGA